MTPIIMIITYAIPFIIIAFFMWLALRFVNAIERIANSVDNKRSP